MKTLPEWFLPYESFSHIGDFKRLEIIGQGYDPDFQSPTMIYRIIDGQGFELEFSMQVLPPMLTVDVEAVDPDDMRTCEFDFSKITGNIRYYSYESGGVRYVYEKYGKLVGFTWLHKDARYLIYDSDLSNYPEDDSTFIGQLIYHPEKASQLIALLFEDDVIKERTTGMT